jgi:uncharacterized protein YfbU (UPF0304 family)
MRLDPAILGAVDQWREEQADRPSRAEAIRRLVETGLTVAGRRGVAISDGEKLILSMLTDLLTQQGVKSDLNPKFVMSALYGGHYWGLRWEYSGLFHGHRDRDEHVADVTNFLDMWFFLETGFDKLSPQDKERVKVEAAPFGENVKFRGFDGNNEADYLSIARFLIDDLERFTHFASRDLNSHMPVVAGYRRMYQIFERIRPTLVGRELSAAEIVELLNARKHPDAA